MVTERLRPLVLLLPALWTPQAWCSAEAPPLAATATEASPPPSPLPCRCKEAARTASLSVTEDKRLGLEVRRLVLRCRSTPPPIAGLWWCGGPTPPLLSACRCTRESSGPEREPIPVNFRVPPCTADGADVRTGAPTRSCRADVEEGRPSVLPAELPAAADPPELPTDLTTPLPSGPITRRSIVFPAPTMPPLPRGEEGGDGGDRRPLDLPDPDLCLAMLAAAAAAAVMRGPLIPLPGKLPPSPLPLPPVAAPPGGGTTVRDADSLSQAPTAPLPGSPAE